MCVAGFASFPASDSQPPVPRPMSVNPFTVSVARSNQGWKTKEVKPLLTRLLLSFRGMSTPVEGRQKILSSDPPPHLLLPTHPSLGSEGEMNLRSCHFFAFEYFQPQVGRVDPPTTLLPLFLPFSVHVYVFVEGVYGRNSCMCETVPRTPCCQHVLRCLCASQCHHLRALWESRVNNTSTHTHNTHIYTCRC